MIRLTLQAVDIELDGAALGDGLEALFDRLDTTDLHADLGEHLLNVTDERFEAERAPNGTPWAPLSPATLVAQYEARGTRRRAAKTVRGQRVPTAGFARYVAGKKILQEMGRRGGLRGTVAYRAADGEVALGSNKVYARIHQMGGTAGRGVVLPARPYLGVSDDDRPALARIVARWLEERVGR